MTTREFRFSEGTSNKFWRIHVDGTTHTIVFGRVGSAGQTQTKEYGTGDEAARAAEKLVAEKLRKGYVETGDVPDSGTPRPAPKPRPARVEPAPAEPAAPAEPEEPAERRIDLDPDDWRWAAWRRVPPRALPAPEPFDRERALARLAKVKARYWWSWTWEQAKIAPSLTHEEAHFWFAAMAAKAAGGSKDDLTPKGVAAALEGAAFSGTISISEARTAIEKTYSPPIELFHVVARLLAPLDVVELALAGDEARRKLAQGSYSTSPYASFGAAFREYLLPYLAEEEAAAVRERLRPEVSQSAWAALGSYDFSPVAFQIAAALGMSDELRPIVESWPDDAYTVADYVQHYHRPFEVICGLDDPRLVEAHARRLKLRLGSPEHVRAWLAHTEYAALDWVRDSVLSATNKEAAASLFDAFALVHAPEAAPHMLDLVLSSKAPRGAREWLDLHPHFAADGLVPIAGGKGKLADAAVEHLRSLARRGKDEIVRDAIAALDPETAGRVRAAVVEYEAPAFAAFDEATTPQWLRDALAEPALRKARTPAWIAVEDLPPVSFGAHALGAPQAERLLAALQIARPDAIPALVRGVRTHADAASRDALAWRLFERWLADGAPSKEGWALRAVGLLGGDPSVLRLAPLVRAWPGESQHQRAVAGIEVMRAVGTDTAIMQINGIAQKVSFKGLKKRAAECMDEIAKERGLTRAELEDRIVPDCGLDERGSRVFDFGPRRFEFLLGADMKPMVREPGGKPRPDLPKPGAKDDAALAAQAVADWKLVKKQIAEVSKIQATRLERAMVVGRRWSRAEFETLLVGHPLMRHLVRMLVWGVYDTAGALAGTFRVTEDEAYADERDEAFVLAPDAKVGVVHALALSPDRRAAWGELLGDYEIVPPFAQLGRPVHALEPAERGAKEIVRFKSVAIPATALVFTLEKLGWERGIPQDGGVFFEHSKPFPGADVTAVVVYDGVPVGYMEGWDDQHLERCFFVSGIYSPEMYPEHKNAVTLAGVDDVAISEVLADLIFVASKGK
jgi:predicted DNA-binding WGR domain protein